MGTDKAMLAFDEETLLDRAIRTAKHAARTVALLGDKQRLRPFGWVIEDVFPGHGPLGGIHAALKSHAASEYNLFLAVDMPSLTPDLLAFLLHCADESNAVVTAPRSSGHLQTLCAVYRPAFAEIAEAALGREQNKIELLYSRVRTRIVDEDELLASGFSPTMFDNVNTPDDWQKLSHALKATHG
jgi:molybdopterin-guanine dinucleotide biosynthesis protein A